MPQKKARKYSNNESAETGKRRRVLSSREEVQPDTQLSVGKTIDGDVSLVSTERHAREDVHGDTLEHGGSLNARTREGEDSPSTNHAEDWKSRAFERIAVDGLAKKHRRWHVLIPKTCNVLRLRGMKCIKLGATYPSPESAARAADRALIAMWGRLDAEDYLNFPLRDYDGCFQRYGVDLTRYFLGIIEKGKEMVDIAKSASRVPEQTEYSRRLGRVIQQNKRVKEQSDLILSEQSKVYKFHKNNCGVCPSCRQPWLEKVCVRYKEARNVDYKFRDHATMIVDGSELSAYKMAISRAKKEGRKDIVQKITEAMYEAYPLPEVLQDQANTPPSVAVEKGEKRDTLGKTADDKDSLEWLMKPFPNKKTREFNRKHTASAHAQLQLRLTLSMNQEMKQMKEAALEYDAPHVSEFQIKRKNANGNIYKNLLMSIDQAAAEGSRILFIREDAPTWMKPNTYKLNQCSYCKTWHRPHLEYCPFMQATCAVTKSNTEPLCLVCNDEKDNCSACLVRCTLPDFIHHPQQIPAPYLSKLSPEMLKLLESMRELSSAAISEFNSPHLSDMLTPQSLLALAVIAEAMVDTALERIT